MSDTVRLTISIKRDKADRIKTLVERGVYSSVSGAFDAGADAVLDEETQRQIWWTETLRRCDEAEKHPERLMNPDDFFREVRQTLQEHRKVPKPQ